MNLYETVKAAVPLREASTRYGLRVNWSGMTRCLFHEDHTLSMKLNENYFYCFGCGTHGDVMEETAGREKASGVIIRAENDDSLSAHSFYSIKNSIGSQ